MPAITAMLIIALGVWSNAVETGAVKLDPLSIDKTKAKIEHVYNLNK